MKNRITNNTDIFELLPNISEKDTIQLLAEIAELGYKKTKPIEKIIKLGLYIYLFIICINCWQCIYHKEYLLLMYIMIITTLVIYIYKECKKNINLQKQSSLFVDNEKLRICSYKNIENAFFVNDTDENEQVINEAQIVFLVSDYIMLAFKNKGTAILKSDKSDKEQILHQLHKAGARIISYDKMPENILWMKKYYKKIFVKISVAITIIFLLYSFMLLTK